MRLSADKAAFIKSGLLNVDPDAKISLFGSRTDDQARGGDIDILVITSKKIPRHKIRTFKISFYKRFGWQKIDIVNFTDEEESIFKSIASEQAVPL